MFYCVVVDFGSYFLDCVDGWWLCYCYCCFGGLYVYVD